MYIRCIYLSLAVFALFAFSLYPLPASAERSVINPPLGAKWADYAEKYLNNYRADRPFDRKKDTVNLRCVKMNNYGCLWQPKGNWPGTPGANDRNGAHDGAGKNSTNGHSIFVHPKWSIAASFRWFETRAGKNMPKRSAYYLAQKYAPWCDIIGSKSTRRDKVTGILWGRGCRNGVQPPAGFSGPRCVKPANDRPSAAQCRMCNCPNHISAFWLKGSRFGRHDPLTLFSNNGQATKTMQSIISWKVGLETGYYRPNKRIMNEALRLFKPR